MSEWKEVQLGDCIDFLNGYAFKSSQFSEDINDIALVKGENLSKGFIEWNKSKYWDKNDKEKYAKFILKKNDILLAMDRPWVGGGIKYSIIKKSDPTALLVQRVGCIRTNEIAEQHFIKYVIASDDFALYLKNIMGGVAVPHISPSQIKSFKFLLPALPTQKRIAYILSAYDDLIENNLKRIKLLEELAQRTYEEWFVKFRINGEQLDIGENGLPDGLIEDKFDKYFKIHNGYAFKSEDYQVDGIKILRTRDYSQTKWIEISQPISISKELAKSYTKYQVQPYDLMLIMVGASIGNYGIVLPKDIGVLQNQNQWAIRSKDSKLNLYKILMMENLIKKLLSKKTGAARDFFRAAFLNEMNVIIPDEKMIIEFNKIIRPAYLQINTLFRQNELLKESRDILLPRLMGGKIEIGEVLGMVAEPK